MAEQRRVITTNEELQDLGFEYADIAHIVRRSECACDKGARFPGIAFPIMHNGNFEHAWVARCDDCDLFASDEEACFFVARTLKKQVAFAKFDPQHKARPYIVGMTFSEAEVIGHRSPMLGDYFLELAEKIKDTVKAEEPSPCIVCTEREKAELERSKAPYGRCHRCERPFPPSGRCSFCC